MTFQTPLHRTISNCGSHREAISSLLRVCALGRRIVHQLHTARDLELNCSDRSLTELDLLPALLLGPG